MNYIQLKFKVDASKQEELIAILDEQDAIGFEQDKDCLIAYFKELEYNYAQVHSLLQHYKYSTDMLGERNWNAEWEQSFEPVVVDDFCAVRAHFHKPIKGVKHEIIITPKMSFGTGHHPTTYLMIQAMQEIDFEGKTVFDFGTGSGILAILSAKLGAEEVNAIDLDPWSVENAVENFERNKMRNIGVSQSSLIPANQFDVILANINRNIILEYMPILKNALKPDGLILFSGLLLQDEDAIVKAAMSQHLRFISCTDKQGWLALCFDNG